jgi:HK97 family phage portal protein
MERQGRADQYGTETMDVDAAQQLAVTSSWVFSDIQVIANRVASDAARPVAARYVDGKWQEEWDHAMTRLLANPNGLMSGSFMLRYLAWWYLLSGNAYCFVSTPELGRGEPQELWPLVASQMAPLPETLRESRMGGLVIDYEYTVFGVASLLPGEHVIHFRTANPWDYWRGLAPLTGALTAVQGDTSRAKWDRDFFGVDNAVPTAVISLPAEITDSDFDRAQEEIRAEFGGRRRTAITRAGDLSIETIQQTMSDMQMVESRQLSRVEIDRVYGVPEGLFSGGTSGESRLALESTFATNTIQPILDYFAEEWTQGLAPFYGEDGLTAYARSVVPRDRSLAVQEYTIYSQDRTVNENRAEQGLERLPLPLADVPVRLLTQAGLADAGPGVGSLEGADAPVNVAAGEARKAQLADGSADPDGLDGADVPSVKANYPAGSPAELEGLRVELKRWMKVALGELRAGRPAAGREFASQVLPEDVAAAVRAGLASAADEDAVKLAFAEWLGGQPQKAVDPLEDVRRRAERAIEKAWKAAHTDGGVVRQIEDGELDPTGAFDALWMEDYRKRIDAKLLPALSKAAIDAAKATAGQMGVTWQLVNEAVLQWSQKYGYTLISGLTQTTQAQVQNTISAWIASGEPLPDLTAKLTEIFKSPVRAQMIASTEVTRLYQVANEQSWRQANVEMDAGIVGGEWRTAVDEKVCFPAWTLIETENGPLPIQRVKPGMRVQTRQGLKQVVATKTRRYLGEMVEVQTDLGSVIATANHPFWTIEHGWLQGSQLDLGHTLETFNQQPVKVLGILDFFLGNAADNPVARLQEMVLSLISLRVLVPIGAVNLHGDALVWQQKVNRVTTHASLLNEFDTQVGQRQANRLFQQCFAVGSSIAGERTKLAVGIARNNTQHLATNPTFNMMRRAAAFLRAVLSIKPLFGRECFATPFAGNVFGGGSTALSAANSIAVSDSSIDGEGLTTDWANLTNQFATVDNVMTATATETASLCDLRSAEIGQRTADGASYLGTAQRRSVVAKSRTEATVFALARVSLAAMLANFGFVFVRHVAHILTDLLTLYHKLCGIAITVYNLQVEDVAEYYANGILVHNCEICGPLEGQQRSLNSPGYLHPEDGQLYLMPAHVRCRCSEVPVLSKPGSRQRGPGPVEVGA